MKKIKLFEEFANEALNPNEFEKAVKDLAYSMPNHTSYEDVPTEDQIMTAMKKYQKDLYKHSTTAQKKEAVEKVLQILSESLDEAKYALKDFPIVDWQRKQFDTLNAMYYAYLIDYAKSKGDKDAGKKTVWQLSDKYGEEIKSKLDVKSKDHADIARALIKAGIIKESLDEGITVKHIPFLIKVGTVLNFKDGEEWKVTKIIGNASNPRGYFAKPHDEKTKKANTSMEIEMTPEYLKKELSGINEATTSWAKMMKGVKRSETGPWTLVAIQDRKVVAQDIDIKDRNLLPASFETMRKEWPKAKIHIEDGTGMVVWNESVNEAVFKYTEDDINMMNGFYGTLELEYDNEKKVQKMYLQAVEDLMKAYKMSEKNAIRVLDSREGRHFADIITSKTTKPNIVDAMAAYFGSAARLYNFINSVSEGRVQEAKAEDMTPEEVASKWKKGTKIKWSSPNGVLDDMVMGHDGIYIKIKSGGTIPYQSIVESRNVDVTYAIKDIKSYNSTKKTPGDFNKMVTSIIKNLGFDDTDDNFERIADHLGNSADEDDNIPEDKDLVNELFGLLESVSVNEAKTMDRDDMMTYLEDKYGFRARTTEEFDNSTGGIWVSGEDGQSIGGKRIYSYYSEGKAYEFGVLVRYEKAINKLGWYSEWYDAGTVMIWPL